MFGRCLVIATLMLPQALAAAEAEGPERARYPLPPEEPRASPATGPLVLRASVGLGVGVIELDDLRAKASAGALVIDGEYWLGRVALGGELAALGLTRLPYCRGEGCAAEGVSRASAILKLRFADLASTPVIGLGFGVGSRQSEPLPAGSFEVGWQWVRENNFSGALTARAELDWTHFAGVTATAGLGFAIP